MKVKVPSTPEGLQELMNDGARMKEIFAAPDSMNEFFAEYAKAFVSKNPDTTADLRTQVQSILFDLIRENGGGRKPAVDLANSVTFSNGRPTLSLSRDGTSAIARGKGTVYNKSAPGAAMEKALADADRFASIGEYCAAIRYKHTAMTGRDRDELVRKLDLVAGFQNSFSEGDPGSGGFLVPEIMRSELLQLALEDSIVRSNATVIPMSTLRVPIPMVDDTSHSSSLFGGVVFYWTAEAASITESQATFGQVVLDAKKLTGYFKVPNELLADAPAFSGWFDSRIPAGLAWYEDLAFMRGDGAGTPLGFIGCPAYVTIDRAATNAISYADIVNMYARMLPTSLKNAVWIASIDSFPQLAQMTLSTPGVWMGGYNVPGVANAPPISIFGRPVYFTEKVPATQASGGKSGDISFVDLSYYLIGDRQAVAVAASEHAAFQNDQTAYRLIERVDGRPWVQSALTPHNGGATLSPYVGLSATHT